MTTWFATERTGSAVGIGAYEIMVESPFVNTSTTEDKVIGKQCSSEQLEVTNIVISIVEVVVVVSSLLDFLPTYCVVIEVAIGVTEVLIIEVVLETLFVEDDLDEELLFVEDLAGKLEPFIVETVVVTLDNDADEDDVLVVVVVVVVLLLLLLLLLLLVAAAAAVAVVVFSGASVVNGQYVV